MGQFRDKGICKAILELIIQDYTWIISRQANIKKKNAHLTIEQFWEEIAKLPIKPSEQKYK